MEDLKENVTVENTTTDALEAKETTILKDELLDVSPSLTDSIKAYQVRFSELNNSLELLIRGFVIGRDFDPEKYHVSFSEDLTKMTLKPKA